MPGGNGRLTGGTRSAPVVTPEIRVWSPAPFALQVVTPVRVAIGSIGETDRVLVEMPARCDDIVRAIEELLGDQALVAAASQTVMESELPRLLELVGPPLPCRSVVVPNGVCRY